MSFYAFTRISCTFRKRLYSFPFFVFIRSFLSVEAINLIARNSFYEKRIGYLVLSVMLDQDDELLPLLPNSLHSDLHSRNNFIVSLALNAVPCIADADTYRQLLPDIESALTHQHTYIRKKAVMCAVQGIRKDPSFCEVFSPKIKSLISERSHAVVIASCSLLMQLNASQPELIIQDIKVCFILFLLPFPLRTFSSRPMSKY